MEIDLQTLYSVLSKNTHSFFFFLHPSFLHIDSPVSRSGVHTQNNNSLHSSMNRMKAVQPNTRKEPVPPPGAVAPPSNLANYTLPGVIGYLTSEFTNLERYKIVTSLEKLEMESRIQQLTAELNATRFLNDKQALRIRELEKIVETNHAASTSATANTNVGHTTTAPNTATSTAEGANASGANLPEKPLSDIPAVDLGVLRRSRESLHRLIHDVMSLLRPPSAVARNYVDVPPADDSGDFDDLLERAYAPTAATPGLFERYTLGSDDLLDNAPDAALIVGAVPLDLDVPLPRRDLDFARRASTATLVDEVLAPAPRLGPQSTLASGRACAPVKGCFVVVGDATLAVYGPGKNGPVLSFALPCDANVVAAYPVGRKVVVVTADAMVVYSLAGSEKVYEFDVQVAQCAADACGHGLRVACAGTDGAEPCVVVVEYTAAGGAKDPKTSKGDSERGATDAESSKEAESATTAPDGARVAARFSGSALGANPISALGWSAHNVVVAHGQLLVLCPDTKTCTTIFDAAVDGATICGDYAIVRRPRAVVLLRVADASVVATQHAEANASYGLMVRGGAPYLVHLDKRVRILDRRFDEVVSADTRGDEVVWCAPDYLVVRAGLELCTMSVEWPEQ